MEVLYPGALERSSGVHGVLLGTFAMPYWQGLWYTGKKGVDRFLFDLALRDTALRAVPQGEVKKKPMGFPHPEGEHSERLEG